MPSVTFISSGNHVNHGQNVSDNGNNHNHIEEVKHSNNEHPKFPAATKGWING